MTRKKRKGYKKIVVDDVEYQYAISFSGNGQIIIYQNDQRYVWPLLNIATGADPSWRGEHGDGGWGKREVAAVIRRMQSLSVRRAAGGHLAHLVPAGKYTALCGHCPESPKTCNMKPRARWVDSASGIFCKRCLEKAEKNADKTD